MKNRFVVISCFFTILGLLFPPIGSCKIGDSCFGAADKLLGYTFSGFDFLFTIIRKTDNHIWAIRWDLLVIQIIVLNIGLIGFYYLINKRS